MTGHQPILAMRRAGLKPTFIWVSDFERCHFDGRTVRVHGDTPEIEDFRLLLGVTAIVEGPDADRVARIVEACKPFAKRVIASTFCGPEVVAVTDTEGVMAWPT